MSHQINSNVESNCIVFMKDVVDIYEDCGGDLEDVCNHVATLHGNQEIKNIAQSLQRTIRNLKQKKHSVNN